MSNTSNKSKDKGWSRPMSDSVRRLNDTVCEKVNQLRYANQPEYDHDLAYADVYSKNKCQEDCIDGTAQIEDFTSICEQADENKRISDTHYLALNDTSDKIEDDTSNDLTPSIRR